MARVIEKVAVRISSGEIDKFVDDVKNLNKLINEDGVGPEKEIKFERVEVEVNEETGLPASYLCGISFSELTDKDMLMFHGLIHYEEE